MRWDATSKALVRSSDVDAAMHVLQEVEQLEQLQNMRGANLSSELRTARRACDWRLAR